MIENRAIEIMEGHIRIPYADLTQNYIDDFHIIVYYLAEQLPEGTPFDLGKWNITDFDEKTIEVYSNERNWIISLDNVYTMEEKIGVEYRFLIVNE